MPTLSLTCFVAQVSRASQVSKCCNPDIPMHLFKSSGLLTTLYGMLAESSPYDAATWVEIIATLTVN